MRKHLSLLSALTLLVGAATQLYAQGTAFTYQGRLNNGANPANGAYDLRFAAFDTATLGVQQGGTVVTNGVGVTNGLFTVTMDLGGGAFTGAARWLEIGVRTNGGGAFATLSPRQPITPTPYAITAANVAGPVPTSALTGTLSDGLLPANVARLDAHQTFTGTNVFSANVGLGTPPTTNRLEVADVQTRARLSSAGVLGSVLELGNLNEDPSSLGSIDFTHTTGLQGQIGYSWSGMDFMTAHRLRMRIDSAGNVGIGTASPLWPLHVSAGQSVVRLDSTANGFGSVLELRNTTASPVYLGAINFNNAAGTYPGQIGYTGDDGMVFRTSGAERMRIMTGGYVGIGTSSPGEALHVERPQANVRVTSTGSPDTGSLLQLINTTSNATAFGGIVILGDQPGESVTLRAEPAAGTAVLRLYCGSSQTMRFYDNLTDFDVALLARQGLTAGKTNSEPIFVARWASDGKLIAFRTDSGEKGSISVAGETVSYNGFTGSHYAWTEHALHPGQLVRMTGANLRFGESPEGEVVYGVASTSRANAPSCLGAYLALQEPAQSAGATNPHLVMAVGNGDLWVTEDSATGDLEPGDYLISSDVPGCAMKDDPVRFPIGYICARAGEGVSWSEIAADSEGVKRKRISVLFESFARHSGSPALAATVQTQQAEIDDLKRRLAGLERLILQANNN